MKRLLTALVLATTVAGTTLVATPAFAGCNGASCEGQDPQNLGCSTNASTIDEFTDVGIRFEMRYSSICDAVWTRVTSANHYNTIFGQIRSYNLTTLARKKVAGVQVTPGTHWTTMLQYSGQWVKTCEGSWFTSDPSVCTAYH